MFQSNAMRFILLLTFLAAIVLAYGQAMLCQESFPHCDPEIELLRDQDCDQPNSGKWEISEPIPFAMFACNNWYNGCGGTPGSGICNVLVKYTGTGRTISCESSGLSYYCMEEITGSTNLKRDCAGNFCDVPGAANESPYGDPPAGDPFVDGWDLLPEPPEIPNN